MQSLDRLLSILQVLASEKESKLRLSEIAGRTSLNMATSLRLLEAMNARGLIVYEKKSKTFALGPELTFLGLSASRTFSLVRFARTALESLAEQTGDTAYLAQRTGTHSICVDRVLGSYPVQIRTVDIGDRRPLGVGGGSLALLAAIPESEADAIVDVNAQKLTAFGLTADRLKKEARQARRLGYAFTESHVVPDVAAVAVVARDPYGNVIGAVTSATISARFSNGRKDEVLAATRQAARQIEKIIGERSARAVAAAT